MKTASASRQAPAKTDKRTAERPRPKSPGRHSDDHVVAALGERVKALRLKDGLTLEQLARNSGVSRAMLSKVERGEKSCTISIMTRIGRGLGITLTSLLSTSSDPNTSVVIPKAKREVFIDPETGFERHLLTPAHVDKDVEMLMHRIPPGKSSGELPVYTSPTRKYIVVQEGTLRIRIGSVEHRLATGDAAHFQITEPYTFINDGNTVCSYYVVIVRRP